MDFDKWKKIFDEVGNVENLDKNNIIEKIKEKLQVVDLDIYQEWEEKDFNVNYLFYVSSTTDEKQSLLYIANKLGHNKMADFLVEALIKNNANFQLIYDSHKDHSIELLSNQRVVDGLNSINHDMLKTICKYNDKFSYKGIERLLSDKEIVVNIPEDLKEIIVAILDGNDSERSLLELLRSRKAHESSDSKEDVDFSDYEESDDYASDSEENEDHYNLNYEEMETSSENQNAVMSSTEDQNDCNDKILQFLFDRFPPKEITELLENQKAVDNVTHYTIEKLQLMFDPYDLSPQNIIKVLEHITSGKFKILCERFDFEDTKALLENHIVVECLESIDYKKLELICNKLDSGHIQTLLKNQKTVDNVTHYTIEKLQLMFDPYDLSPQNIIKVLEHITSGKFKILCERFDFEDTKALLENHIVVECLESIDYKKLELICNKLDSGHIQTLLKNQKTVDNVTHYTIEELRNLFYGSGLTFQDIIKVLEDINSEKSRILLGEFSFSDIYQLLKNQMVAKVINDITPEKLKFICNKFYFGHIQTLLENQKAVNNINNYTIEELLLVLYTCGLSDQNIIKILEHFTSEEFKILCEKLDFRGTKTLLENQEVVNNINNYTIEELHSMFDPYDFSDQIITIEELLLVLHNTYGLSDQNIIKVLEHFTLEKLHLMYEKFDISNAKTLLENQKAVNNVTHYTIEELRSLLYSFELSPQNIIKILEDITSEKFRILCERFDFEDTKALLENHIVVERLESIDYKKLKLICNKLDSGVKTLLKNQKAVDNVTHYTIEELRSLLNSFELSPQNIIKVLEHITSGKFKILCERFDFEDTKALLENENAVKYIGSVNDQKLEEIIDTIHSVDLVNIFKNFTHGVKSTLRLAIALHRAGKVRDINIDYLNNKNSVYNDIIEYFPPEVDIDIEYPFPGMGVGIEYFPLEMDIDKTSLIPFEIFEECIACEEPVSKLYNLALEQLVENINPHKRARYS